MAVTDNFKKTYFTGAQTRVYLNGAQIVEATRIEGAYSYNHYPLYGYRSTHFDAVAGSHVLVTGNLIINYVSPAYLYSLILEAQERQEQPRTWLDDSILLSPKENFVELPEKISIAGEITDRQIEKNIAQYWGSGNWGSGVAGLEGEYSESMLIRPEFVGPLTFEIRSFKLQPSPAGDNEATYKKRIIKDAFLTGSSMGAGTTEEPLTEVYSFIARTLI
jgi:hypothetical protein